MLLSEEETTLAALQLLDMWIERHGVPAGCTRTGRACTGARANPRSRRSFKVSGRSRRSGRSAPPSGSRSPSRTPPRPKAGSSGPTGSPRTGLSRSCGLPAPPPSRRVARSSPQASSTPVFAREPASAADFHRALAPGEDLAVVLRVREERVLTSDYTLRHEGRVLLGPQAAGSAAGEGHAHRRPVPGWHPEDRAPWARTRLPGRDGDTAPRSPQGPGDQAGGSAHARPAYSGSKACLR